VALAWAESGRVAEALAAFEHAESTAAPDATGDLNWGIALSVDGDVEGAVARFRKAIELRADYAFAHENLAGALERLGRPEEARTHRLRAEELNRQ
jgi:Flp pilus assembly protein TadD